MCIRDRLRADMPPDGSTPFDHRLMVPVASYAATGYITGIRGIIPEHRSSGEFRQKLKNFAIQLDELAQGMRTFGLARTIYTKAHFDSPMFLGPQDLSLIHISEPTRLLSISYAVFCL